MSEINLNHSQIYSDDVKQWYAAQELVYASMARGNYSVRLTISDFSDTPTYTVTRRHVTRLTSKELYCGGDLNQAVRKFNDAVR